MINPILIEFFHKLRPGWKPPSAYQISHKLLDTTTSKMQEVNSAALNKAVNLTLMLDGWTDVNNTSLINVAIYAGIPIFVKSIQPGPQRHDASFIAEAILQTIETGESVNVNVIEGETGTTTAHDDLSVACVIDEKKFRSVVTDQPSVMKAAWKIVETRKPWIYCYGCGAHVLNLLAGDCRKIALISEVIDNNRKIALFFRLHSMAKEVFKEITKSLFGKHLNVVLSCATRWSTDYFMIVRNLRLKVALVNAAIDSRLAKEFKDQRNAEVKSLI